MIALCPSSPQECFDLTIRAFNLAERFRIPVMLMLDECVGHMTEKVVIPAAEDIEITPRRLTTKKPGEFRLFEPGPDGVPDMAHAGDGYDIHVTGLTHNEIGYADLTVARQDKLVRRLVDQDHRRARRDLRVRGGRDRGRRCGRGVLWHHFADRPRAPCRWQGRKG